MERILLDILDRLRAGNPLDARELDAILKAANAQVGSADRRFAKKHLLPYYLDMKENDPTRWESWQVDPALEERFVATVQMKPRRTASGVATITVITRPGPCSGACRYCPNDVRMPKSYLADEPACQRAERNWFDPYLQTASRLHTLEQMGHITDKIELIVLGGSWCDYPESYQTWFITELFRALNEGGTPAAQQSVAKRRAFYRDGGIADDPDTRAAQTAQIQQAVDDGRLTYNQAVADLYGPESPWAGIAAEQTADLDQLEAQQRENETARHRMVGLVIETRPETLDTARLARIRRLGCTKVQMGVQSLDAAVLESNGRTAQSDTVAYAFDLARAFGFKIHAHFMVNLRGSTPESDKRDYRRFVTEKAFQPDEIKLYPCALIDGTALMDDYRKGTWQPYSEDELTDVLAADLRITPPFVRVSRVIRDFSAGDIVAGNRKGNLRQLVENRLAAEGCRVQEIRGREVGAGPVDRAQLALSVYPYETRATSERFLQWTAPDGRIAGFLRLSLPHADFVSAHEGELPVGKDEAMIREVHVYGRVAGIHQSGHDAQHTGLGRQLIDTACDLARQAGYTRINVISAVGTREYYRRRGFFDNGLYQTRIL